MYDDPITVWSEGRRTWAHERARRQVANAELRLDRPVRQALAATWGQPRADSVLSGWSLASRLSYMEALDPDEAGKASTGRGPVVRALSRFARHMCWFVLHGSGAVLVDRPVRLKLDAEGRPHAGRGMAVMYPDGWGVWCWHGTLVPRRVIEEPHSLTLDEVNLERNLAARRAKIDRFGRERYRSAVDGTPIQEDECGALFRRPLAFNRYALMVRVRNTTPEPNGEEGGHT